MADSEAVRSRRKRMHAAGDHSLCRRCASVREATRPVAVPDLPAASGEVTDAPSELRQLAYRLAEAHRADPVNALLARELRMTLADLMPKGKQEADADLAGLFAEFSAS